jgi:hypothetical protein
MRLATPPTATADLNATTYTATPPNCYSDIQMSLRTLPLLLIATADF